MRTDEVESDLRAEVVDVPEAAKILKISRNSAYEAIKRKEIPSIRLGRRLRVPRAGLDKLLAGDR
jgi:excisionase family DNA binding protein